MSEVQNTEVAVESSSWLARKTSGVRARLASSRGAISIEYVGIVAVVGILVIALITGATGWSTSLTGKVSSVVTGVTGTGAAAKGDGSDDGDCGTGFRFDNEAKKCVAG